MTPPLFSCEDLWERERLRKLVSFYNLHPQKKLGQHFLYNKRYLQLIADSLGKGETAIEIGAGLGSLTCLLTQNFSRVVAIEVDKKFKRPFMDVQNRAKKVSFICADFLQLDLTDLTVSSKENKIVGNIPYELTSPIIEKIVDFRNLFSKAVLTVQKEVGERLVAKPGTKQASSLTFLVKSAARTNLTDQVPPSAFFPRPKVSSSVIEFDLSIPPRFTAQPEIFFPLIRGVFNYRRKTIKNALRATKHLNLTVKEIDNLLQKADIESRKRPEELTITDFDSLARQLAKK